MIVWTGKQTTDPETFDPVLQADADGNKVSVRISQEAVEDYGIDACKRVAEQKLTAASESGTPPKQVQVTTADFAGLEERQGK